MKNAEVLVVGGGPAGASTAFHLASRGVRVTVLDRARFPRAKPCAECLSPAASRLLVSMGALPALDRAGVWLRGMVVHAPNGVAARGDYAAAHGYQPPPPRQAGLSIRREILDAALLDRARAAGACVREGVRVTDLLRDASNRVTGVRVLGADGALHAVRAPVVVGADGLRSLIARRLGLARAARWPRRLALIAHYRDVRGITEYGEMHVRRDGFVGIADVGQGLTTVAAVFPAQRAREIARDRHAFLDDWLASQDGLRDRFARARRDEPVTATGPFASHARRAWHAGALLVGDAADFFDPFTGEGIHAALRGGEMAADAIAGYFLAAPGDVEPLREYDRARRREFGGKWRVERIIGASVAWPWLVNRATLALASRKELADLLVGVTGDFVPAREVLRLGYLARLFLMPAPPTEPRDPLTAWP